MNRIVSLALFVIVFTVYALTASRSITFWDSPEFITSSYNLQATHPPGAPFYTMLCSVILQFFPATKAALVSNLISGFFGALTVTFLFKITYLITTKIQVNQSKFDAKYLPYFTGITSALTLAFSNSFWTAATESEVYTLSFALMTLMLLIALKWESTSSTLKETKFLLLFSFVFGIATGVHLITISIIIPLTLLFSHKKFGLSLKNIIISLFIGCILFFSIYLIAIQGIIKLSHTLDVWLVNSFSFEMNSGFILTLIIIATLLSFALWLTKKNQQFKVHYIVLFILFFLIGLSSYLMPLQRAQANTLITNNISNSNKMLPYITGEQFGISKIPLVKGYSYNAPLDAATPFIDIKPTLAFDPKKKKYITTDDGLNSTPNYADEFSMYLPRVFKPKDENNYKLWVEIKGEPIQYTSNNRTKTIFKPTQKENFNFFINYQVQWLNMRYLYWNFIGKQNNNLGTGNIKNGNWVSGINVLDKKRVGDFSIMPERYRNDKSRNAYYFIPFILGLIGFLSLIKQKQYLLTTLFIFLAFGLGITFYINPIPSSILVRERDYIFIGSYIIFSLWVGLSIISIYKTLSFVTPHKTKLITISLVVFLGAPLQLFAKGWDDHQRKLDTFAYNIGKAYLDACPKQGILITNGDNMTFPLWYLQDVENYRTDVRVLNFDLMGLESNIEQVKRKIKDSDPIKMSLKKRFYVNGVDKLIPLQEEIETVQLPDLFNFFNDSTTRINWNGKLKHYIPATKFTILIDTLKIKKNQLIDEHKNTSYASVIKWDYKKYFYRLNEITLLNIITNNINERPILFAINGKTNHYLGLDNYLIQNGLVEQLAPIKRSDSLVNPKIVNTKMMYPYVINNSGFDNLNDATTYINYENKTYAKDILRRSHYFLAQALIEENQINKALAILDNSFATLPNKTISYKQYAYALGKLYFKAGQPMKGNNICALAMTNIWDELSWITSFNTPNPIINVKHAEHLKNMYTQMIQQFPGELETKKTHLKRLKNFETNYNQWFNKNWPY